MYAIHRYTIIYLFFFLAIIFNKTFNYHTDRLIYLKKVMLKEGVQISICHEMNL